MTVTLPVINFDGTPMLGADGQPLTERRTKQVPALRCARLDGHTGPHQAYRFRITAPEEWDTTEPWRSVGVRRLDGEPADT